MSSSPKELLTKDDREPAIPDAHMITNQPDMRQSMDIPSMDRPELNLRGGRPVYDSNGQLKEGEKEEETVNSRCCAEFWICCGFDCWLFGHCCWQ